MKRVKKNEIYFSKIREGAKIPTKRDEDAGYDLYACFDEDFFVIEPGETKAVPTAIAMAFNKKYYAQIEERSSMAKIGIKKSGGVMDSGYRGEYFIMTYNTNKKPFIISKIPAENLDEKIEINGKIYKKDDVIIYPYTKAICEVVLQVVPKLKVKEVLYEDLMKFESQRKTGGFGSTTK